MIHGEVENLFSSNLVRLADRPPVPLAHVIQLRVAGRSAVVALFPPELLLDVRERRVLVHPGLALVRRGDQRQAADVVGQRVLVEPAVVDGVEPGRTQDPRHRHRLDEAAELVRVLRRQSLVGHHRLELRLQLPRLGQFAAELFEQALRLGVLPAHLLELSPNPVCLCHCDVSLLRI